MEFFNHFQNITRSTLLCVRLHDQEQRIFGASAGHDSGDYLCVPCPLSQKLPPRIPSSPPPRRDVKEDAGCSGVQGGWRELTRTYKLAGHLSRPLATQSRSGFKLDRRWILRRRAHATPVPTSSHHLAPTTIMADEKRGRTPS